MERILVALDGSQAANDALDTALVLAHETGARVTCLTVRLLLTQGVALGMPPVMLNPIAAPGGDILHAARERARHAGLEVDTLLRDGRPVDQILAAADELDVDLVVVGSRGLGSIRSALLGSVSRAVTVRAQRPVMVVRHQAQHALV